MGFVFDQMTLDLKVQEADWKGYKVAVPTYEYLPMAGGIREGDKAFQRPWTRPSPRRKPKAR